MSTDAPHRSLADDVRSRSADQICAMLVDRPDLAWPWPTDLSQLARRAADDASVLEAMQGLDTTALRVLEVFAALHEATIDEVVAVLPESHDAVQAAVNRLWQLALLWGGPTFRIVRAAQQAFGPYPCGLAPAGHESANPIDADQVRQLSADLDEGELAELVWRNPVRSEPHPLLTVREDGQILSRSAALVLRDGMFAPPPADVPTFEASQAATGQFLWLPIAGVRYLLSDLTVEPLACHESRGVSRRTITDRAESMRVPVQDLMVWLELAALAGLIGVADDTVRPTSYASAWLHAPVQQMWTALIEAWLGSDRMLTAARPDEAGCLTTNVRPRTGIHRRHVLAVWPAAVRVSAEGLARVVGWSRPRMHEAVDQAPEFFTEVHALGLAEAGVATDALRVLVTDIEAASALVPPARSDATLIVQPDNTVIAGADIDTATWQLLADTTSLESWGPVTMHRFDPARIRQAVSGRDPQQLLERLRAASKTDLPQSLEYLFNDAARGSAVRVSSATLVEVTPADAQAVEALGFTPLTELVFTTDLDESTVRTMLAEAGVAAAHTGPVTPARPMDYPASAHAPDPRAVRRLVQRLLGPEEGDHVPPPQMFEADPQTMADVCRSAIQSTTALWLSYSDDGKTVTELVEPVDLRSGSLTGWSITGNRAVNVALARIASYQEGS